MSALFLNPDNTAQHSLTRVDLTTDLSEDWLQALIYDNPALLPIDEIEPGSGPMVPLVRELALPKPGGCVFLDLLGVTPQGRLVLIECKLWRNPQARREVVAQILEYAALLRQWSYADLTARLKARQGWTGANPIYGHVMAAGDCLEEAAFSDAVARSLRLGDFDLVVAGDGIREDMAVIAEHLQGQGARLALVEFQIWKGEEGQRLIVPNIPFRTEVIRQRVLVNKDGTALQIEEPEDTEAEAAVDPDRTKRNADIRAFWQRFIDEVEFDHPDQPIPRHGGVNWVKIPLPGRCRFTAFRTNDDIGFFIPTSDTSGAYANLSQDEDAIREEVGIPGLRFHRINEPEARDTIGIDRRLSDFETEQDQLNWLKDTGNRLVNAIRPRLSALDNE